MNDSPIPVPASAPPAPRQLAERFGSDGLQQLVYVSKAAPGNSPEVLTDILRVARQRNHSAGITGLLVYFDGRFLQYLEGPALAVQGTLSLIRSDRRHFDMEVLLEQPTDRRLFRTWDMGCLDVGSEGWRKLVEADWPTVPSLGKGRPSGLQVLQEMAEYPAEAVDRPRTLGAGRPEENIAVADVAPELRAARLQLAAAVAVGVVLAGLLVWNFVGNLKSSEAAGASHHGSTQAAPPSGP